MTLIQAGCRAEEEEESVVEHEALPLSFSLAFYLSRKTNDFGFSLRRVDAAFSGEVTRSRRGYSSAPPFFSFPPPARR